LRSVRDSSESRRPMFQRSTAGFEVLCAGADDADTEAGAPPLPAEELAADPPRGSSQSVPATSAP
jgi:hypothetical protein